MGTQLLRSMTMQRQFYIKWETQVYSLCSETLISTYTDEMSCGWCCFMFCCSRYIFHMTYPHFHITGTKCYTFPKKLQ